MNSVVNDRRVRDISTSFQQDTVPLSQVSTETGEPQYSRILDVVKPERATNNRKVYREYWWQFGERRPALRKAITELDNVLVLTRVSDTLMPIRVSSAQVFSDRLTVFASDSLTLLGVLSSSIHSLWAIKYGTTHETRVTYNPSAVFETFPQPANTYGVTAAGELLDTGRREVMLRREFGLTHLYNLVNDPQITEASEPDIARMRAIHVELDNEVLNAYGWSDITLDHGFHTYRQMQRWTVSPAARVEILDRLLEENHRRAAEEAQQEAKPKSKGRRGGRVSDDQGTLL